MKIYLLEWESSDMIGGFYGDTLEQCFNTDKSLLLWSIQHTMEVNKVKSCDVEILTSHEELNNLRRSKNLKPKPVE